MARQREPGQRFMTLLAQVRQAKDSFIAAGFSHMDLQRITGTHRNSFWQLDDAGWSPRVRTWASMERLIDDWNDVRAYMRSHQLPAGGKLRREIRERLMSTMTADRATTAGGPAHRQGADGVP